MKKELAGLEGKPEWAKFRRMLDLESRMALRVLESPPRSDRQIVLPSVLPLARAYGLSPVMFDPLMSRVVDDDFLLHRPGDNDIERFDRGDADFYGSGMTYRIPRTRLQKAQNIAFVDLEIEPAGESKSHFHPGDELLIVEAGPIEVWLEDTGLRVSVKKGEFIHLDAGQLHKVVNPTNEKAKVFLIRFSQFRSGTRAQLFREVGDSKPSEKIVSRLFKEMKTSVWPVTWKGEREEDEREEDESKKPVEVFDRRGFWVDRSASPVEVFDRRGLGNFLRLVCAAGGGSAGHLPLSLDKLVDRAKQLKWGEKYNRSKFARLHHGQMRVMKSELPELAKIYDVSSMLLYDFLFPAFRYAVVVGRGDMTPEDPAFEIPEGVSYFVPCRRLAHSDVTLALVKLKKDRYTVENCHPGVELLKVLEGEVTVRLRGIPPYVIKRGEYGYFSSQMVHCVGNEGSDTAEVLAIRFLE
ncbi:MAG: cupin domain-containing protein [Planctomycetota bacterium]